MTSMIDALRAKHKALGEAKTVDIPLPGYDTTLVARYRVLDVQNEINAISKKVQSEFQNDIDRALYGSMDSMARACVELFTTDADGKLQPLADWKRTEEDGDVALPPIRYDKRLAEFMGWDDFDETTGARGVILRLYQDIEPMIMEHGQTLSRWMSNVTRQVNDSF